MNIHRVYIYAYIGFRVSRGYFSVRDILGLGLLGDYMCTSGFGVCFASDVLLLGVYVWSDISDR